MVVEAKEDPRIKTDICGVGHTGPTGLEWICVRKPHDKVYIRKTSDRTHRRGDPVFGSNPGADRHYMVNRWPNRNQVEHDG